MTELVLGRDRADAAASPGTDARRVLQLVLAATWLLDGLLQYQSSMYSTMFGDMIGDSATGNPGVIAGPISWNADLVAHHLVLLNTAFATLQLLLGLGIAYSPDGRYLLTVDNGDNTVTVIDTADDLVIDQIPTGKGPTSISILPNGHQAYVSDDNDGTIEILNLPQYS